MPPTSVQYSSQYLFCLYNSPKAGNGNDVAFWNLIFGISNCHTTKQRHFCNLWAKLDKMVCFFYKRFYIFKIMPFLTWTWLICQIWKWVSPSNFMCQMTLKHVTWHFHYSRHSLFSYVDPIWPDLDLCFPLVSYLHDNFTIPSVAEFAEFAL